MTIAAGFTCDRHIVICADREITRRTGKTYETKIWSAKHKNLSVVATGAGSFGYLKSAAEKVLDSLVACSDVQHVEGQIRRVVSNVYREEISKDPHVRSRNKPSFDLIVAASDHKFLQIFRSESVAVRSGEAVEFVGAGDVIARYFFDKWFSSTISIHDGIALATHVVSVVKESGLGCGGPTDLYTLDEKGEIEPLTVKHLETIQKSLRLPFRDLLFALSRIRISDDAFDAEIARVTAYIKRERESLKRYQRPLTALLEKYK